MKLNFDFFEIDHNSVEPQKGRVLISDPFLDDMYFKRSIVFLTEHTNEGSVGFVLNNPVNLLIKDVINDFPEINAGISIGGPVGTNTIHFIHTLGEVISNSIKVIDNLYWGGDFEKLKDLIDSGIVNTNQVRFFLGYSGWMPNQLKDEIKRNSWIVSELDSKSIMNTNNYNIWKESVNKLGAKYKVWANIPENPAMN